MDEVKPFKTIDDLMRMMLKTKRCAICGKETTLTVKEMRRVTRISMEHSCPKANGHCKVSMDFNKPIATKEVRK